MEKLKEKNKHDHLFTKILKVSIFALVMLAPMFSVAAKCMYVAFNKNAKDSYYGETINEKQNVYLSRWTDMKPNNTYTWLNIEPITTQNISNIFLYVSDVFYNGQTLQNVDSIRYQYNNANQYVCFLYEGSNYYTNFATGQITFNLTNIRTLDINNPTYNKFYYVTYNDYSYVDNVFYYSVEQLGNEQIFSWTKNTGIYTAINTMTTGLGIDPTNNILAVLLTYWSLITAVYIIIDIVIEMFVRLTHLLA